MTLMSHLLVAAVLDERGQAYWDCTAPVSFVLKVSGRTFPLVLQLFLKFSKSVHYDRQTFLIIGVEIGSPQFRISTIWDTVRK